MNLSIQVICNNCKKPCDILSKPGYKKIHKKCCNKILCTNGEIEAKIINGILLV